MAFMDPRERARLIARERQLMIAEGMSKAVAEEYQSDILAHLDLMEMATLPDVASIDLQSEIQWYMRPYLLDFLVEAHEAFQLLPDTLFLTVNLLDRYCSRRIVYKRHYQLVGCAALLVAAKYSDRKDRVPTIPELQVMCCSNYDNDMFEQMERHLLQTLEWTIGHPTIDCFLQIAVVEESYDAEVEHMARYIAEIAMYHRDFVSLRASVMARSALALARMILQRPIATPLYSEQDHDSLIMLRLTNQLHRPSQILSRKYASSHLSSVAVLLEVFLERQALLARVYRPPSPPVNFAAMQGQQPQTPQKQGLPSIPLGVLTPPITPDGDATFSGACAPNVGNPPMHRYPSTPTSIPGDDIHDGSGFHNLGHHYQDGEFQSN